MIKKIVQCKVIAPNDYNFATRKFKNILKMKDNLKRQVEVQGTKKLDSVKGVQVLELNEMKETEGGIAPLAVVGIAAAIICVGVGAGLGIAYITRSK